ncbi:MAG TPA: hypothetical protein PLZ43_15185 [bacterium]|nr:hypothetical protein [bacterium]
MNSNNNNIPKEPDFSWLFKNKTRPSELKKGQLWTIFGPVREENLSDSGQVVVIKDIKENFVFVIPVHATESTRTILDPVILEKMHTAFPSPLVAVVHMAMTIGKEPFETAKYIGEIKPEGMEIIKNQYEKYLKAIDALAFVQIKDAHNEELTDEEEKEATKAGIYKLCPVNGDIDSLIEFNNEISDILQPWHVLAMAESFAFEEEKQASEVAEKEPGYGFFQKVASKIKIFFNDSALDDFFPATAGEASKADHRIPVKINVDGQEEDIEIILEWDDRKDVTKIWLEGDCVSKLCHENIEIEVHFENKEVVKHQFDNDDKFVLKIPLKQSSIVKIIIVRNEPE